MNQDVKDDWIAALTSGDYKQGQGALNRDGTLCCLGVLCELAVKAGVVERVAKHSLVEDNAFGYREVGGTYIEAGVLPDVVQGWAGLPDTNPRVKGSTLGAWNDKYEVSFTTIARLVEEEL